MPLPLWLSLAVLAALVPLAVPLTIPPPSGQNPIQSLLGRESDFLTMAANQGTEWMQFPAPQGGYMWGQYWAFTDPVRPADLAGTLAWGCGGLPFQFCFF